MGTVGKLLPDGGNYSNSGTLSGTDYGIESLTNSATIVNSGSIIGTNDAGVSINDSGPGQTGTVTNNSGGSISGASGVEITGAGMITNSGKIVATSDVGALIGGGGAITNNAGGSITGLDKGVEIDGGSGSTPNQLTNKGSIAATAANTSVAVTLGSGGTVNNAAGASIIGGGDGIESGSGSVTLTNAGTIQGTAGFAVTINDAETGNTATVTNTNLISGAEGVAITGEGAVTNSKTITATAGTGVLIGGGGSVTNNAGDKITGVSVGVEIDGGDGSTPNALNNSGMISATAAATSVGVALGSGGTVDNATGASISGGANGLTSGSGSVTLTNEGTIAGKYGFGVTINDSGASDIATVTNTDLITGGQGVAITGEGMVTNSKTITATAGTGVLIGGGGSVTNNSGDMITGLDVGVEIDGGTGAVANNITNDGTIKATATGTSVGVSMGAGGWIHNNANAAISGGATGVAVGSGSMTLVNAGTITGTSGFGVTINDSGASQTAEVTNTNIISGGQGVAITGKGVVTNSKTITATAGTGVLIGGGGSVVNNAGDTITGLDKGVEIDGGSAVNRVTNDGTISATAANTSIGLSLGAGGTVQNNAGATISGGADGVESGSGAVTLTNLGTITGTSGFGVTINNPGPGNVSTVNNRNAISGAQGVAVSGAANVTNSGTIAATVGTGVLVGAGGSVTNNAGARIEGVTTGVEIDGGTGVNKLTNSGAITASAATGVGASLGAGGTVVNNVGATINGGATGVATGSGATTVANGGTITGTRGFGVTINGKGVLINSGTVTGAAGVAISGLGLVSNTGTITATNGTGLTIGGGGTVGNGNGAKITGTTGGVEIDGGLGNVTNNGTITASAETGTGVTLGDGGAVENLSIGAVISGGENGVECGAGGIAVVNAGQITGAHGAGVDVNGAATVTNANLISGGEGITVSQAGQVTNTAIIRGTTGGAISFGSGGNVVNSSIGAITGATSGVEINGASGSVVNDGSITVSGKTGDGVSLGDGGKVSNAASGAKITGAGNGVNVGSGNGTVANSGTITGGSGAGVTVNGSGSVTNAKSISGASGVVIAQSGNVTNSGTIKASSGVAISIGGTGAVYDQTGGAISGVTGGVSIGGALASLINAGSISVSGSSGDGVKFASTGALDNLASGTISGGQDGVLIEGAGTIENDGSISGTVGAAVVGVGTIVDDGSISSSAGATGTAVSLGATGSTFELAYKAGLGGGIAGFGGGDTLLLGDGGATITGYATAAGPSGMTTLTLEHSGAAVASVDLVGNFVGDSFSVTAVGGAAEVAVTLGQTPKTVTVANFEANEASLNKLPGGFAISDTAANIATGLSKIEADASHVDAIHSSNGVLSVALASFVPDKAALDKVVGGFALSGPAASFETDLPSIEADFGRVDFVVVQSGTVTVSVAAFEADQPALAKVASYAVSDSAAAIGAAIESLAPRTASISSIDLTDIGTPTLDLTEDEVMSDAALLAKIAGAYDLDATGVFGEPYDAYDKQFDAAHKLLGETFLLPGPASGGTIDLPDVQSQIQLAVGASLGAAVSGFGSGDTIDFEAVAYAAGDHAVYTANSKDTRGVVTIEKASGAAVANFVVDGVFVASNFAPSIDANGDLLVGWRAASPLEALGVASLYASAGRPVV